MGRRRTPPADPREPSFTLEDAIAYQRERLQRYELAEQLREEIANLEHALALLRAAPPDRCDLQDGCDGTEPLATWCEWCGWLARRCGAHGGRDELEQLAAEHRVQKHGARPR